MMKKALAAGILAFASMGAFCTEKSDAVTEQSVTLTVDQAVEYALANSRTLKSDEIDLKMKKRAKGNSWNVFLPDVSVTGTMTRVSDDTVDSGIDSANKQIALSNKVYGLSIPKTKAEESNHWTAVTSLDASWNFNAAYIARIQSTLAAYEGQKISFEKSRREIETNVISLFNALLLEQESLNIDKSSLNNARERMVQAGTNFRNGHVPELAYLKTQVAYENKKPEVAQKERTFKEDLDTFVFILGLPVGTEIKLSGKIEPVYVDADVDSLIAQYGGNNLDIQKIDYQLKEYKRNLDALNLGAFTPSLFVKYQYAPMLSNFPDADKGGWPNGGDWKDNGMLNFGITWNLTNMLPFSSGRQQAADLKDGIKKIKTAREILLEQQKMEVRKNVNTIIEIREQIDSMTRNIDLARRSYQMTDRAYRNGTTELLDVRDAEEQLNQAKLGLLVQKMNYINAVLKLETTLNTKLVEVKTDEKKGEVK